MSEDYVQAFFARAYLEYFPSLLGCQEAAGRASWLSQSRQVDRYLYTALDQTIRVKEVLCEYGTFPHLPLEIVRDGRSESPGWIAETIAADYVAFGYLYAAKCWILPTIPLQAAWQRQRKKWLTEHKTIWAGNRRLLYVPIEAVTRAMGMTYGVAVPLVDEQVFADALNTLDTATAQAA